MQARKENYRYVLRALLHLSAWTSYLVVLFKLTQYRAVWKCIMIINIIIMVIRFLFNTMGDSFIPKCLLPVDNDNSVTKISCMVNCTQWFCCIIVVYACALAFVNACMHVWFPNKNIIIIMNHTIFSLSNTCGQASAIPQWQTTFNANKLSIV